MSTLQLLDKNAAETKETPRVIRTSALLEDRSVDYLVSGVNEDGQRVWFYRAQVNGLHPRLFGPFARRSDAIEGFDAFLKAVLEALCDCFNNLNNLDGRAFEFIQLPAYVNEKGR